jgi:hypothetical protein
MPASARGRVASSAPHVPASVGAPFVAAFAFTTPIFFTTQTEAG